ncbi:tetratricopeptide repeat protein [Leptospira sp. GIMC2001]|uniref:tetratricopeptide repeat protein n=1 Tax=Leptospira sp. GIMC2001 TaxID=1513297 RepID=UPI00234B95B8|nr:tetratricopeptide repeat protein [Leptospira sp. GIMC2001]WCL50746.1 tetratricopeptide repeat protein [Leptospira sp. GIMC2001]
MEIIYNLDDLLFTLFPDIKRDDEKSILQELSRYYAIGSYQPEIILDRDRVKIKIEIDKLDSSTKEYNRAIGLCEAGKFQDAKILLASLIEKNPTSSDLYRMLGQIHSEEGDQEKGINYLIEALKWDNKNKYALTMMGNIFFIYKSDPDTALIYFNQVLKIDPNDFLALNNIGSQLGKLGRFSEAKTYFERALRSNPEFPNTYQGLGLISDNSGNLFEAFNYYLKSLKFNPKKDALFEKTLGNIIELSTRIIESKTSSSLINDFKSNLEIRGKTPIEIKASQEVPYYAKIEYAEIYDRDRHIIKYKPTKIGIDHLVMHELAHLMFALDAKENNKYQLIASNEKNKSAFYEFSNSSILKLRKRGVVETDISNFLTAVQEGIISQAFNTPIDLFIEDYLYRKIENLRPYQFLSLYNLVQESIKAVTDPNILEIASELVVSKSKIYNLVNAFQFRDLYNIDMEELFNANPKERKIADSFYKEFLSHKESKKPGIEYKLIDSWSNRLDLDRFFYLVIEEDYLKQKKLEESFQETAPLEGVKSQEVSESDLEMAKFLRNQEIEGVNKSIIFYMIGALEYFKNMSIDRIKVIAMEIARIGMNGISPDRDGYIVTSIPEKTFSGNHLLAYYYVSWKLAIPEMVDKLQLPFREEFDLAEKMYKSGK